MRGGRTKCLLPMAGRSQAPLSRSGGRRGIPDHEPCVPTSSTAGECGGSTLNSCFPWLVAQMNLLWRGGGYRGMLAHEPSATTSSSAGGCGRYTLKACFPALAAHRILLPKSVGDVQNACPPAPVVRRNLLLKSGKSYRMLACGGRARQGILLS